MLNSYNSSLAKHPRTRQGERLLAQRPRMGNDGRRGMAMILGIAQTMVIAGSKEFLPE